MVSRKNLNQKFALISVFDKGKLNYLCKSLDLHNYNFISTGSTGKKIRKLGFDCIDVSKITKFKEMFDGRVKTLNPLIYSSILHIRDNHKHKRQFSSLKIPKIDIVIVNLYPFYKYSKYLKGSEAIEMIDIGGPSLLRAASKNYKFITPIIDKNDYEKWILNLNKNHGHTDETFRKKMALKIFRETSNYDRQISQWFNDKKN